MFDKKFYTLEVGSKVFVKTNFGTLREYEIIAFRIIESDDFKCEVETKDRKGDISKFPLELFITGIIEAREMKIKDIDRI